MFRVIFVNGRTFGKPDPLLPTYSDFSRVGIFPVSTIVQITQKFQHNPMYYAHLYTYMFVIRCNYHHTIVKSFPEQKRFRNGFRTKSLVVEPPLFSKYAQVKLDHFPLQSGVNITYIFEVSPHCTSSNHHWLWLPMKQDMTILKPSWP